MCVCVFNCPGAVKKVEGNGRIAGRKEGSELMVAAVFVLQGGEVKGGGFSLVHLSISV